MESLYAELKQAGIETSNHESDLYFRETSVSIVILEKWPAEKKNAKRFISQIDKQIWIEVPFAFIPFWETRLKSYLRFKSPVK